MKHLTIGQSIRVALFSIVGLVVGCALCIYLIGKALDIAIYLQNTL